MEKQIPKLMKKNIYILYIYIYIYIIYIYMYIDKNYIRLTKIKRIWKNLS